MITIQNVGAMLEKAGYILDGNKYRKNYAAFDCEILVDLDDEKINYPDKMKVTRETTCNFSDDENFVVLECVTRLLDKGYRPEHIELEKLWSLGHLPKSGYADILVQGEDGKTLCIVECKTFGKKSD